MKFKKLLLMLEELSREDLHRYFKKIDEETFNKIISLDPTATEEHVGKYANWLLHLYNKKKLQDTSNVTALLSKFDKEHKNLERKNISKYNSIEDLQNALSGQEKTNKVQIDKNKGMKVVYKDDTWIVETPTSYEASCDAYGEFTSWCTASKDRGPGWYEDYEERGGTLYIIRNRFQQKPEAQFYINDGDLEEAQDRRNDEYMEEKLFEKYPKLANYFKKLMPKYFEGEFIRVAGRRLKYNVDANGVYVFKSINISDANLTEIPEALQRLA